MLLLSLFVISETNCFHVIKGAIRSVDPTVPQFPLRIDTCNIGAGYESEHSPALTGSTLCSPLASPTHSYTPPGHQLCIGDFRLIQLIGRGRIGNVYHVINKITDNPFALRVIKKGDRRIPMYSKLFEEQMIGKEFIYSPWAVGVQGSFEDSENLYMIMVRTDSFLLVLLFISDDDLGLLSRRKFGIRRT